MNFLVFKKKLTFRSFILIIIIDVDAYLHPQTHLVSHPQFLENSYDVSLWLSAEHRKNKIRNDCNK